MLAASLAVAAQAADDGGLTAVFLVAGCVLVIGFLLWVQTWDSWR